MKKCSKCGTKMIPDLTKALTSDPLQYEYKCPKCGNIEYGVCHEYNPFEQDEEIEEKTDNTNWKSIRIWAAVMAMNGLLSSDNGFVLTKGDVAIDAVAQADRLIEELKK